MKLKKGISLIVLIITIIIMLILATVIVMSLSNNNVIEKANTAVKETNLKSMEEAANVALGDLLLENSTATGTTTEITADDIEAKMKENGVSETELAKYTIGYDDEKVSVNKKGTESSSADTLTSIALGDSITHVGLNLPLEKITLNDSCHFYIEDSNGGYWEFQYQIDQDINSISHPYVQVIYNTPTGNGFFSSDHYGEYRWESYQVQDKDTAVSVSAGWSAGWSSQDDGLDPANISITGTVVDRGDDIDFSLVTQLASWFKTN